MFTVMVCKKLKISSCNMLRVGNSGAIKDELFNCM